MTDRERLQASKDRLQAAKDRTARLQEELAPIILANDARIERMLAESRRLIARAANRPPAAAPVKRRRRTSWRGSLYPPMRRPFRRMGSWQMARFLAHNTPNTIFLGPLIFLVGAILISAAHC